jgi:uncharacterized protein (DUF305 family)
MSKLRNTIMAGAMATAVGFGVAWGQSNNPSSHSGMSMPATASGASMAYMDAMKAMMQKMDSMPMTGDTSIDFAQMMIPHHQSAIDMAQAYLKDGQDPELRKLSEEIVSSQQKEIRTLETWLSKHRKS